MGGNRNQKPPSRRGLIVGNYCHDVLIRDDVVLAESLGGAVSFISTVLDGLSIPSDYVTKVGSDFAYTVNHLPILSSSSKTTLFHAYFSSEPGETRREDRVLKRVQSCDPISPSDLPEMEKFDFGMAVGVAGEISPETLEKMINICNVVFVDIQALIRNFDPIDGTVKLVNLKESGFFHLLPRIGFLKASAEEAPFVDIEEARKWCCVLVTSGKDGCTVYWKNGELQIAPFPTVQVDPTGAGDSFLGGLVGGLVCGLTVCDAALLGNFFGSLTVGHIGLRKFDLRLLQRVKDEMQRRKMQCIDCCDGRDNESKFLKPIGHDQFLTSLSAAKLLITRPIQDCHWDMPTSPKVADQVLEGRCSGRQMLFVNNAVYEEPIKSVESKP